MPIQRGSLAMELDHTTTIGNEVFDKLKAVQEEALEQQRRRSAYNSLRTALNEKISTLEPKNDAGVTLEYSLDPPVINGRKIDKVMLSISGEYDCRTEGGTFINELSSDYFGLGLIVTCDGVTDNIDLAVIKPPTEENYMGFYKPVDAGGGLCPERDQDYIESIVKEAWLSSFVK